ncbi:uncharacterized protein LOC142219589 [Haematobia irritans]|uniref:uncharacterized protein LOC142219589 n=1 Tax=Haematobia irritans TaxID=7368 RepID=UPI003F50A781
MNTKWSKCLTTILVFAFLTNHVNSAAVDFGDFTDAYAAVNFGTALKMFYMAFQRIMPCGYPPMNIPVLAPFTMDVYNFNLSNGYYSINGNVSNLMVLGLNDYHFLKFTFNETTNRTLFDFIFPEIKLLAESEFDAMAYVAGYRTTMSDSGLLDMKLVDFRVVGELTLAPNQNGGLQVSNFGLNFYVGDAIFNNWNNIWDISANNFVNKWAREFLLMWSEQIQVQVKQIYAQLVLPNLNGILNDISMTELVNYLLQETMTFNSANCTL